MPYVFYLPLSVCRAFAYHDNDKQIARALGVSPSTIHSHVKGVFRKVEAKSRNVALALGLRSGPLTPNDVTTSLLPRDSKGKIPPRCAIAGCATWKATSRPATIPMS